MSWGCVCGLNSDWKRAWCVRAYMWPQKGRGKRYMWAKKGQNGGKPIQVTFLASFPIDFAYRKQAGKPIIESCDRRNRAAGCKYKLVTNQSTFVHMTTSPCNGHNFRDQGSVSSLSTNITLNGHWKIHVCESWQLLNRSSYDHAEFYNVFCSGH